MSLCFQIGRKCSPNYIHGDRSLPHINTHARTRVTKTAPKRKSSIKSKQWSYSEVFAGLEIEFTYATDVYANDVLYGKPVLGKRPTHKPKRVYKDCVRGFLKKTGI